MIKMGKKVKSGKEILEDFFKEIQNNQNVDQDIAQSLSNLFEQGKLTDANIKNELQRLREQNER